jgi:hypothetical protein
MISAKAKGLMFGFTTNPILMRKAGIINHKSSAHPAIEAMLAFSVLLIFVVIALGIYSSSEYPLGLPTVTISVLLLGGVEFVSVGLLGEYIGRIYEEIRQRPMYIVDRAVNAAICGPRGPLR